MFGDNARKHLRIIVGGLEKMKRNRRASAFGESSRGPSRNGARKKRDSAAEGEVRGWQMSINQALS
jgi:hypothetical protein